MFYSVRMRSAEGGPHETGGRHISGAERIVHKDMIAKTSEKMLARAFTHTRGQADFINITVEKVEQADIQMLPILESYTLQTTDVEQGRQAALETLVKIGVTSSAAQTAMSALLALDDSMRGAMVCCAVTGERLDAAGQRGIRVSRMDIADESKFITNLKSKGINNTHVREAIVLATKVANAPGVVAELCWSDDPEYTTGYVASKEGYIRLPHCKPQGSTVGGRVFFIEQRADITALIEYLQYQPVLVEG